MCNLQVLINPGLNLDIYCVALTRDFKYSSGAKVFAQLSSGNLAAGH